MIKTSVKAHNLLKWSNDQLTAKPDVLAVEEPLEIRLNYVFESKRIERPLSVTMRTPGNDLELALGFLFSEGIINSFHDISSIRHCENVKEEEQDNVVKVTLIDSFRIDPETFTRNFYTTSSCGVCGKSSIDAITVDCPLQHSKIKIPSSLVAQFPNLLRATQTVFEHTGGIHASALFDLEGNILTMREDVGRHNALDKVVGAELFKDQVPLSEHILLVSGRASFELIQKAARAGIPIVLAVGAPSSLAVELAEKQGITLLGFLKSKSFNVYSHPHRISN